MSWQVQEAKQRFSEVVRLAVDDGPQVITRHGVDVVVILDMNEYRHLTGAGADFKDFLRRGPAFDELDIERSTGRARVVELVDEDG